MAGNVHAWYCFHENCAVWGQTETAIKQHVHAAHGVDIREVWQGEHYGTRNDKREYEGRKAAEKDQDIEAACRGFRKWLDSIRGADDFAYETGGL